MILQDVQTEGGKELLLGARLERFQTGGPTNLAYGRGRRGYCIVSTCVEFSNNLNWLSTLKSMRFQVKTLDFRLPLINWKTWEHETVDFSRWAVTCHP